MKQLTRSFLCILLLSGAATVKGDCNNNGCSTNCNVSSDCSTNCGSTNNCSDCHSALMPRSANDNLARRLEEHYGHRFDADCFNGGATLADSAWITGIRYQWSVISNQRRNQ